MHVSEGVARCKHNLFVAPADRDQCGGVGAYIGGRDPFTLHLWPISHIGDPIRPISGRLVKMISLTPFLFLRRPPTR